MDCTKLSDFEINKAVAVAVGFPCYYGDGSYSNGHGMRHAIVKGINCYGSKMVGGFDPCNEPSDAWRIITENRIMINPYCADELWKCEAMCSSDGFMTTYAAAYDKNPLRAAMIAFLMMKEKENARDN